jgi:cell fate regulator YaaT (PSP1 superfamily)
MIKNDMDDLTGDMLMDDETFMDEEDFLEDNPEEGLFRMEDMESVTADTPVYQLRLSYSHETFNAAYRGDPLKPKTRVLVPTRYGRDLAQVIGPMTARSKQSMAEMVRIERPASQEDLDKAAANRVQEEAAFKICKAKIAAHNLTMKLVSVHYLLEEPKVLFFFTAENRVDFRELVKDLVGVFKSRIELRQIGVRDESRVMGGLGVCGRHYCCHAVSDKLKPVSIKMAKDQNLSLNSMKISGPCGRLLCCLAYEHNFYGEQRRLIPPEGSRLSYEGETWRVVELNVISGKIRLTAEDGRQVQLPVCMFEKLEGRWTVGSVHE